MSAVHGFHRQRTADGSVFFFLLARHTNQPLQQVLGTDCSTKLPRWRPKLQSPKSRFDAGWSFSSAFFFFFCDLMAWESVKVRTCGL